MLSASLCSFMTNSNFYFWETSFFPLQYFHADLNTLNSDNCPNQHKQGPNVLHSSHGANGAPRHYLSFLGYSYLTVKVMNDL